MLFMFKNLACRHHIHELIVANVFNLLMGFSSGPTITLFERFSAAWKDIDKSNPESSVNQYSICGGYPEATKGKPYPVLSATTTRIPPAR